MRTRFLSVWFLAIALIGVGWWQGNHDVACATTYYVTNNNNSGPGSLRAAVDSATDGDDIHVVAPGPIELNSTIAIAHSVTIAGPEIAVDPMADPTSQFPALTGQVAVGGITNSVNGSVFTIAAGKSVAMSHLFITGGVAAGQTFLGGSGDSAFGGGIRNDGTLTLNYCTIAGNKILAGNGGNLSGNSGGVAYGGGIYSSGTLTLNYSTVNNNGALGGSGANSLAPYGQNAAYGGGIYSTGTTNINSSTISNNTAQGGTSAFISGYGGFAYGGGIAQSSSGTLNLTNATIANNLAIGGNGSIGGNAIGGGVAVNNATLNPLNVTISQNTVTAGTGGSPTTAGSGLSYNGPTLTINNSVIAGNSGSATDFSGAATQNNSYVNGGLTETLADNDGPTLTIDSANASVVDAGDNTYSSSLSLDQRGAPRIKNAVVDAGAVEHGSIVPTNTPPTVTPFEYQILNGTSNFSAAQFLGATNYGDAGDSLKSIILTYQDFAHGGTGYFELNGQVLLSGSVISVDDLNNLVFVSNDPNNTQGSFTWQPSDGVNPVPSSTPATVPGYTSPQTKLNGSPYTGSDATDPSTKPRFNGPGNVPSGIIYVNPNDTWNMTTSWTSTNQASATDHTTSLQFGVIGASTSISPPSATAQYGISSNPTITITFDHSGTYNVTVQASDIHGNTSSYSFQFLVDFIPKISNKTTIAAGNNPYQINLGSQFNLPLQAADPDYYVPKDNTGNPDIHPEPLRFQLDQTCYGPDGSTCDTSDTASNIGSFSSSNLSGNLNSGTTLDTTFNWTPTKPGLYGLKITLTDYWGYPQDFVLALKVNAPAAPSITAPDPNPQIAQVDAPYDLTMADYTTDSYAGAQLTYSIVSGLPSWANFDPSTGRIYGTPHTADIGSNTVQIKVTDQFGSSSTATFGIDVVNGAPIIVTPTEGSNNYVPLGSPSGVQIVATDPNGDTLSIVPTPPDGLPTSWASISAPTVSGNTTTWNITGTPSNPTDVANNAVTVNVSDGTNTTTVHFNLDVTNGNPPVLNRIDAPYAINSSVNIQAGNPFTHQFEAKDDDASDPLTFSATINGAASGGAMGSWTWTPNGTVTSAGPPTVLDSTFSWDGPSGAGVPTGTYTVVVTVADGNNNTDTESFTIVSGTGSAPTLSVTPTGTINAVTGNPIQTITATATDADSPETLTFSLNNAPSGLTFTGNTSTVVVNTTSSNQAAQASLQWTPTIDQVGTYHFDIVVTDSTGFQASVPVTISVTLSTTNHAPIMQNPGTLTAITNTYFSYQMAGNDPDGDTITYTATGLPNWASISDTGLISSLPGGPGTGDVGSSTVTVTATDNGNPQASVSVTFELVVKAPNQSPHVTNPGDQTASVGSFFTLSIFASDPDGDPLTYTATVKPGWLNLSATGILSGTPTSTDTGVVPVVITVSDGINPPVSINFSITVSGSGVPTLQASPTPLGTPEQVILGQGYSKTFISHDSDYDANHPNDLTFSVVVTPTPVAPGAHMDPVYESGTQASGTDAAATLHWTPTVAGTYQVVVTVTDLDLNKTSLTFTIHVSSPPTIQIDPSTTISATPELPLSSIPVNVNVSDPDPNETLTLSLGSGAPSGMSFGGSGTFVNVSTPQTAQLTWTPTDDDAYQTYTFDVTVTDSSGQSATQSVTINVGAVNERPTITNPGTITVIKTHEVHIPITATDPEGDPLTYHVSSSPSGLGLTIDSDGVINGIVNAAVGSYQETVTVDDGHHVSPAATMTFTIIVKAADQNSAPEWLNLPDQTVSVGQNVSIDLKPYVSDPDGDTVTISDPGNTLGVTGLGLSHDGIIVGIPTPSNVGGPYPITLTADDGYHGSTDVHFNLTVRPNQPPFSRTLSDYNLYEGNYLYADASTNDPEGDSITYSAAGLPGWASINSSTGIITGVADNHYGSYHVIVTATDSGSGTSTSYPAFTINVLSPFTVGFSNSGDGYATITYTLLNNTDAAITPTVTGSLTGAGYTDNANAFFYASQGLVADQWANPIIQRKLDPTKDTRILTWTLGSLAPGDSATLTISVPIKPNTPTTQQLTNQWTAQYGTGTGSVTLNLDPVTVLTGPVPTP